MKKIFFLFLMLLNLYSVSAYDFSVKNEDGVTIYYNRIDDNSVAVSNNDYANTYSGTIVIPTIANYSGKSYNVTSIDGYAFSGCYGLTTITIPESVTSIGGHAFEDCTSLTTITIPESVTSIDDSAFCGCSSLTSITIPESVTSIGGYAFSYCDSLTSINIPGSVISIDSGAFSGCSSLKEFIVDSTNKNYISNEDVLFSKDMTTLLTYPNAKSSVYNIPESVTSIGSYAFSGCSGLTSITIPESVTSIGGHAFSGCSSLTSITIPEKITFISSSLFSGCSSLASVIIPESVTSIGDYAFSYCDSLTSINIPENVTSIGHNAFMYCSGLPSITIPESVTSIGSCAFLDCSGLTSIAIPEKITFISSALFSGCSSLASVIIPESVTTIGGNAFEDCTSLTSINIPRKVWNIEMFAFSNCSSLTSITIPEGVTLIGSGVFYECSNLTEITIPRSVTDIGWSLITMAHTGVFHNCKQLKNIYCRIENPLKLEDFAFENVEIKNCNLYVPSNSYENYKYSNIWKDFNIQKEYQVSMVYHQEQGNILVNGEHLSSSHFFTKNKSAKFTIHPKLGYQIEKILLNKLDITKSMIENTLTVPNIEEDQILEIIFSPKLFTIIMSFNAEHGTVIYNNNDVSEINVQEGRSAKLTIIPKLGYQIEKVVLNKNDVTSSLVGNTLTITDIRINQNLNLIFKEKLVTITTSYDSEFGSVLINDEKQSITNIQEGKPVVFKIDPLLGYEIEKILLNGSNITTSISGNTFRIESVMWNQNLIVTFRKRILEVTSIFNSEQGNVFINDKDLTSLTIQEGKPVTFTITPNSSLYSIDKVLLNKKDVTESLVGEKLVIESVTENLSLEAIFIGKPFIVATTFNTTQGSVLINGENTTSTNIQAGNNVTFTILPGLGYIVEKILLNDKDVTSSLSNNTLIVEAIEENQFLKVIFNMKMFNVKTIFDNEGGSVQINGKDVISAAIQDGGIVEFIITPKEGYFIDKILFNADDITDELVNGTLIVKTIIENSTLEVTFWNEADMYDVNLSYDETQGSVLVNGLDVLSTNIKKGENAEFTIVPNEGYVIDIVKVNGKNVTMNVVEGKYVVESIDSDVTIEVTFKIDPVSIGSTNSDNINVYIENHSICIDSNGQKITAYIYNSTGLLIYTGEILGKEKVSILEGVYMVKIGNKTIKLLVK